ncbi:hypothetical protein [Algoriphagus hitonicola]|uniref:Uncharacterized protein n=1 Tax=Algoriphagus hitonicola TaxID=435880 RepID=A0A1I2V0Q2_9BACT|nr:hypothetical protein [Algoriphagus hitonicola]SFG80746.1 hypothetical protein SAMN04487988_108143 [Algoriphagus hitonicola]
MIGFEISFKEEKIIAADTGSTFLIFTRVKVNDRDELDLSVTGSSYNFDFRSVWGQWNLKEGDKFEIRVVETEEATEPIKRHSKEKSKKSALEAKLLSFKNLQKKLLEKGLIDVENE